MTHLKTCAAALAAALLAGACASTPPAPDPVPLSEEEIAFLAKLEDPESFNLVQDVPVLFPKLSSLLTAWHDSSLSKSSARDTRVYTELGEILTRHVYMNFETIVDQLENGPPPNRVIAAAALGFSRIPDQPRFPQVYGRARDTLLLQLDCGEDAILENALLSLYNIDDPSTPLDKILEIMVQHHDPDVRANAALAVQATVDPAEGDLVLPYVLPALKDHDPKVRNHAVLIAQRLNDRSLTAALVALLDDRYALIQAGAARALGNLGDVSLCGPLIPLLRSRHAIVRHWSLESLRKLSGSDYGEEAEAWEEWWQEKGGKPGRGA